MPRYALLGFLGAIFVSACVSQPTSSSDIFCTLSVDPALVVYITDSATARPLAGAALGVVRDGTFLDSLRPRLFAESGVMLARAGANERPGTYRVSLTLPGYRAWTSASVMVTRGVCHVNTQTLQARLQPVP